MSVAGSACAVLLILLVASLYRGWSTASGVLTRLPGDVWVAQAGTRDPFRSTSLLPSGAAARLERISGRPAGGARVCAPHRLHAGRQRPGRLLHGAPRADGSAVACSRSLELPAPARRGGRRPGHRAERGSSGRRRARRPGSQAACHGDPARRQSALPARVPQRRRRPGRAAARRRHELLPALGAARSRRCRRGPRRRSRRCREPRRARAASSPTRRRASSTRASSRSSARSSRSASWSAAP